MAKTHDPLAGCETCQNHKIFRPKLGRLKIKNHPVGAARLAAAELEVVWDGLEDGRPRVVCAPETDTVMTRWGATKGHDGYGAYGFEACMAPAAGDKFADEAADFESAFREDGVYVDEQCGGHIHTDARDFCIDDVCKLLQVYRYLEPALFKMLPAWRRKIGQCSPLSDYYMDFGLEKVKGTKSAVEFKATLDAGAASHRNGRGQRGNWHERHVALNVAAWFQHGTVEWRIPPGLVLKRDIAGWQGIFTAIMDASKRLRFFKIKPLVVSKIPTIAESFAKLCELIPKEYHEFAIQKRDHASANWRLIDRKKLRDVNA